MIIKVISQKPCPRNKMEIVQKRLEMAPAFQKCRKPLAGAEKSSLHAWLHASPLCHLL